VHHADAADAVNTGTISLRYSLVISSGVDVGV